MLVLFPFEEAFYREHGVKSAFVGHPLLDELDHLSKDVELSRQRFGLKKDELVLGLMPGSRESELKNHLQEQLAAAELLTQRYPKVRTVLLCAPTIERERLQKEASEISTPIQIIKSEPFEMIGVCDFLLVASGTATLMVGLLEKPMVIMYRMSAITAWFAKRLVKHTRFFGMVNLVMDREVARELFQEEASATGMATELEKFVDDDARRAKMNELRELKTRLGTQGATIRVAAALAPYLSQGDRSG